MVSYLTILKQKIMAKVVLILIVVDNGLVPAEKPAEKPAKKVLILIVVDNGLVLNLTRHY